MFGNSTGRVVPLMGVKSLLKKEEYAKSMARMLHPTSCARSKDAQVKLEEEECALSMGRRQGSDYATKRDAQIKSKQEGCVYSMGQKSHTNCAKRKDAQDKLKKEEYAKSMGQR